MKKLMPLKAVYSYYFPEVREIMNLAADIPDEAYFVTGDGVRVESGINEALKMKVPLIFPKTADGYIDLDRIHEPVIERVVKAYSELVPALKDFTNAYPTAGTSEGIFHLLADLAAKGTKQIYLLEGEYEGYSEYARMLGLKVVRVADLDAATQLTPGFWFISNPSARDGNIIANDKIIALAEAGHKIALDLAYVGATKPHVFEVDHPNIVAAFLSFSKPYGVFRFRIGFSFTRAPLESLYGTRWFKDIGRVLTAAKLVEALPPGTLQQRYAKFQTEAIEKMNAELNIQAKPADVLLLATAIKVPVELEDFRRGAHYRLCLTPYFEAIEARA